MNSNNKISRTKELPFIILENNVKYVEVYERIKYLADNFDYDIITEDTYMEGLSAWKVKATLSISENGKIFTYTGTALEYINGSEVNIKSSLENAETSAVGRACAMAGIGLDGGIASLEEIQSEKRKRSLFVDEKIAEAKSKGKKAEEDVIKQLEQVQKKKNK